MSVLGHLLKRQKCSLPTVPQSVVDDGVRETPWLTTRQYKTGLVVNDDVDDDNKNTAASSSSATNRSSSSSLFLSHDDRVADDDDDDDGYGSFHVPSSGSRSGSKKRGRPTKSSIQKQQRLELTPQHVQLLEHYDYFVALRRRRSAELPPLPLNESAFRTQLKPWQRSGIEWMLARERLSLVDASQPGSGVLADSMGLGKTFSMLVLVATHRPLERANTTLVVCPVALIDEWQRQVGKHRSNTWFSGNYLRVHAMHGTVESRRAKTVSTREFQEDLDRYDIVLTSYNFVQTHVDLLKRCSFLRIVLDEAHQIRNESTKIFGALMQLEAHFRWCMSGSPISNDLSDLHSLVKWLRFTPYSDDAVWARYIGSGGGAETIEAASEWMETNRTNMRDELILRRTKEILELPPLHTEYVYVEFNEIERTVYDYIWDRTRQEIGEDEFRHLVADHCDPKEIHEVLEKLLRIRQCCNHLALVDASSAAALQGRIDARVIVSHLSERFDSNALQPMRPQERVYGAPSSSKIDALVARLRQFFATVPGGKCVVFSQWVSLLKIVDAVLRRELRIEVLQLDGSQPRAERTKIQRMFTSQDRYQVLLASTKACSLGLNLQAASCVCVLEPWWNPQVEKQAIDRVHRLGQQREVYVYRFIVRNTVEERVYDVQQYKEEIADSILEK